MNCRIIGQIKFKENREDIYHTLLGSAKTTTLRGLWGRGTYPVQVDPFSSCGNCYLTPLCFFSNFNISLKQFRFWRKFPVPVKFKHVFTGFTQIRALFFNKVRHNGCLHFSARHVSNLFLESTCWAALFIID